MLLVLHFISYFRHFIPTGETRRFRGEIRYQHQKSTAVPNGNGGALPAFLCKIKHDVDSKLSSCIIRLDHSMVFFYDPDDALPSKTMPLFILFPGNIDLTSIQHRFLRLPLVAVADMKVQYPPVHPYSDLQFLFLTVCQCLICVIQ